MVSKVSLVKGKERKGNIEKALSFLKKDIKKAVGKKKVIIKPNMVSTSIQLAATHVNTIKTILDFLSSFYKKKVLIAESTPNDTRTGFENFNYYSLKDYNIEFKDLNEDKFETFQLPLRSSEKISKDVVRIAKTLLDKNNFIISPALLKTHDTVVATLSLKNILMGSLIIDEKSNDKSKMHKGIKEINRLLGWLSEKVYPDLSVIDGFRGMEGRGPSHGEEVKTNLAISSLDPLAADRIGLEVMKIKPEDVGYLNYISEKNKGNFDLEKIKILGSNLEKCRYKFKMHPTFNKQRKWR